VKFIFMTLIFSLIFSACSSSQPWIETQTSNTQSIQPSDESTLLVITPTNTQPIEVTQSFSISATSQISTPVSTPILNTTQVQTATPTTDVSSASIPSNAIVADHQAINTFDTIPPSALSAAAATKTLFMHQSTGANIRSIGLDCLAGLNDPNYVPPECTLYNRNPPYIPYDNRNWTWSIWSTPMADAIAKMDMWVSVVNAQQSNYQVLGMKLCYVDGWNVNFDNYRQKMELLERTYPQKKFIWTTSALWEVSAVSSNLSNARNIQIFNQQLRAYAIANNKILYDLADIESHDPNGNLCQSNGYEALCDEYSDGMGGGGGGHPDVDGSIRLAKGFWWLMARISGWDGE
jgi:hypothetical protein